MPNASSGNTRPALRHALPLLNRIETVLDWALSILSILILVAMVLVVFVAVVARYQFNAPLIFSYDLSTLLFAWVVFLGLFIAERDGAHIGLDLVQNMKSGPVKTSLQVFKQVLLIALAGYMSWISFVLIQRTGMQIPSMRISSKWLYAAVPIGFSMLTLLYVLRLPRLFIEPAE